MNEQLSFLRGNSEMATLTREFNWSATSLGDPAGWEQSLRTTVGIILNSKFAMFLFWGPELTCFYNDAYRPSLGMDGKHPSALGKPGVQVFPEIWKDIKPIIDNVLAGGEATMYQDLLLPIYRNGELEDVYWTFSYSAVYNDAGSIHGVMVVCQETHPQLVLQVKESAARLRAIIDQAPMAIGLLRGRDMIVETVNGPILDAWGKDERIIEMPIAEALPELKGQAFLELLDQVYTSGVPHFAYAMPAKIMRNGVLEEVYSDFVYAPLRDGTEKITGVMILATVVTDRVVSKRAIERSEARFRSLIKAAPIGIGLFVGRELIIEEPNQTFIDIVGKGDWIIGKPLVAAMPELVTEGQPFLKILDDVFTSGVMFQTTGTMVKIVRDGVLTHNYYDFTYTPLFDDHGAVYAILDIAIDVTSQVVAKQALEKSEENLRNIIIQSPVAMAILDGPHFIVEIANDRMFELWGKPAEQILDKPIWEGLPEATGQGLEALLLSVYHTGETYHGNEVPIKLPRNGQLETAFVNFTYEAFREADGRISGVMVVGNDVTEQVLARRVTEDQKQSLQETARDMQRSNNQLTLALRAGELGLFELDLSTNLITPSPRFLEIFDLDNTNFRESFIGRVHPDDQEARRLAYTVSAETGMLDYTARIIVSDERIRWVRVQGITSTNAEGEAVSVMGIVQDITAAKELEFQKDTFIGIASHELKTPVTSIKAYVQIMEQMFRENGDLRFAEMMNRVDRQVNRLNFLIGDLLDVTKIQSGKLQFNFTSFDFNELIAEVIDDSRRIYPRHRVVTHLKFQGLVIADKDRVNQVFTNLISNAIKYSPAADHINIYTELKENMVQVCVQDFGIGISDAKKDRVFEQFYRVSGTRQNTFPGLGLGLYISSEIVKRLGGKIWVDTEEAKGSTFCFTFPVHP